MQSVAIIALLLCASTFAYPTNSSFFDFDQSQDERIIGGTVVPIEQRPWIVALLWNGRHSCGGSIIRANRILSAAHCLVGAATPYSIRAGSSQHATGGQVVSVTRYINHPQYRPGAFPTDFDISVLHLAQSLNLAPAGVAIIPLPPQGAGVAVGAMATVAGWGVIVQGGRESSPVLRSVQVPIVSQAQCTQNKGVQITGSMICAGFPAGGRDACQNDSGGPLTLNGQVIGVVSWGRGCAQPNSPGVYARVSFFTNWVNANL